MNGFVTAVAALVLYTVSDILVWQRIFEANELWQFIPEYHIGWRVTLYGYIFFGLLHKDIRDKIMHVACFYVFSQNGTEDVLYYWLDGRIIPAHLHWLDNSIWFYFKPVSGENILINVILWGMALFGLYWLMYGQIRNPFTH